MSVYQPAQPWQREAYRHTTICGEAFYAARYYGHALSRAVLQVEDPSSETPVQTEGPAVAQLMKMFAGGEGQKEMLEAWGFHLTVAGEFYIVGRTITTDASNVTAAGEVWETYSILEVTSSGNRWEVQRQGQAQPIKLTEEDTVIRVYDPDPVSTLQATSPFRALLPVLAEVEWATLHIAAQMQSRMTGGGLMPLPSEIEFPDVDGVTPEMNKAEKFTVALGKAMLTPIEDPSSPSAVMPLIITVPADQLDKIKEPLHFWSQIDEKAAQIRSDAIHRFGLGMDLPPEKLAGYSSGGGTGGGRSNGVSHQVVWQVDEETIKLHIEPKLDLIVNSLTVSYLRPALDATGVQGDYRVGYDTAKLKLRPDRSKEALELNQAGLLSDEAALRENGFAPTDAPTSEQFKMWLLKRILTGSAIAPDQVPAAAALFGIDLPMPDSGQARGVTDQPSLDEHPVRERPVDQAALIATCNGLVLRALERVGNRLKATVTNKPDCASWKIHTVISANGSSARLLEDAWATAPLQLREVGSEPIVVVPALERYARGLLEQKTEHDTTRMVGALREAGVL